MSDMDTTTEDYTDQTPVLESRAKARTIEVNGRTHQVRYLRPAGLVPLDFAEDTTSQVRVIEVDGIANVGWILAQGKAYGDPSLPSNYQVVLFDGTALQYEGRTREDVVAQVLR